jgi:SAM-dependent methyltransferase
MYDQVIANLRASYSHKERVEERDKGEIASWKAVERQHFLSLLQQEGKQRLLEIGAGPGRDSKFFQDHGLEVVCTDLSPEMVHLCRQKGLTAYEMDFLSLDFPESSFDAIYALNCLLHVPTKSLPDVLRKLQGLLQPGGLFYLGVYGGIEREGIVPDDRHEPRRFFSYHTDDYMRHMTAKFFTVHSFNAISLSDEPFHFQSIILRRD